MIKAGALLVAIVVSLLIAIFCSFFILTFYFDNIKYLANKTQLRVLDNADSGMRLLLADRNVIQGFDSTEVDLFNMTTDSVNLAIMPWGSFEIFKSYAHTGHFYSNRMAMTGFNYYTTHESALYLQDLGVPLSISGSTFIKGNCWLPKSGVKVAYIEGIGYAGNQLIHGIKNISSHKLPEVDEKLISRIKKLNENYVDENTDLENITDGIDQPELIQSFLDKTKLFFSENVIDIQSGNYSGNIIFHSSKEIRVNGSVGLTDVILSAPSIKILEGFAGSVQAYATDSIIIEENVSLKYPSVTGIYQEDSNPAETFIKIGQNSSVEGVVFAFTKNSPSDNRLLLIIDKKAIVSGELYCNSQVDLKGSVFGSIICSKFRLKTPSSVYVNHLLDIPRKLTHQFRAKVTRQS